MSDGQVMIGVHKATRDRLKILKSEYAERDKIKKISDDAMINKMMTAFIYKYNEEHKDE